MYLIERTKHFDKWLIGLRDLKAKARILARIKMAAFGNLSDHKSLGQGISEMRVNYGPGYRVYYTKRNQIVLILLVGGDKSSQSSDIERAKTVLKTLEVQGA